MRLLLIISFLSGLIVISESYASDRIIRVDLRERPPLMYQKENKAYGPLVEILELASKKLGYRLEWKKVPFSRSLINLKYGQRDIVPRLWKTSRREETTLYLGPIGHQKRKIVFLVKKGRENLINQYSDLKKISIGVKRGTVYFEKFDNDKSLNKLFSNDDQNMVKMFLKNRFDAMIIGDTEAIKKALNQEQIENYSFANYKLSLESDIYYGMSKKSRHAKLYFKLNEELKKMFNSGKIKEIYKKHKLPNPIE